MFTTPSMFFATAAAGGAAPARVQSTSATATNGSVSPTWSGATTAGNLLIAVVRAGRAHSAGVPTITATPAGWTSASADGTSDGASSTIAMRTAIYYKESAASETNNGTWTCSTFMSNATLQVILIEVSGCATSSSLDVVQHSDDAVGTTVTSGVTGTTAATAQAAEFAVGIVGIAGADGGGFTTPLNSFTIDANSTARAALLYKVLSATGAQSSGASWTNAGATCGSIATFKGA